MELSQARHEPKKPTSVAVPQLLTPEESTADSFTHSVPRFVPIQTTQTASPPVSPEFRSFSTSENDFSQRDPLLYPDNKGEQTVAADKPLFESSESQWQARDRQNSPATEASSSPSTPSPVTSPVVHYEELPDAAASENEHQSRPKSQSDLVGPVALLNHYGAEYWRYCFNQSEEFRRKRAEQRMENRKLPSPTTTRAGGRDSYTSNLLSSLGRSRVEKPKVATQAAARSKAARAASAKTTPSDGSILAAKSESPAKRHRRQASTPDVSAGGLPLASQPKARTRAPPTKNVNGKDLNWRAIPDYAPPASTLDEPGSKQLQATWNNTHHLPLDDDPDREHLHAEELRVASVLRLKCNAYLMSKRRIFEARLIHLRENKEFNKTSAQACTSIDVNKASRLWDAFNNVGWFDEKWFKEYLDQASP